MTAYAMHEETIVTEPPRHIFYSPFAFGELVETPYEDTMVHAYVFGLEIDISGQPTGRLLLSITGDGKAHPTLKAKIEDCHSVRH